MSQLVDLFNNSNSPRVVQARQIPGLADDFFDLQNQFQAGGFELKETQGQPTQFTTLAQQYYNTELKNMLIPAGFNPTAQGINLNRWTPDKHYTTSDALGL